LELVVDAFDRLGVGEYETSETTAPWGKATGYLHGVPVEGS